MIEVYAGLDVSDRETHVCVTDGSVVWAGACATKVRLNEEKQRAPLQATKRTDEPIRFLKETNLQADRKSIRQRTTITGSVSV